MAMLINDEIVLMPLLSTLHIQERKEKKKGKTLQQRQRLWQRNQKKHRFNQQLNHTLPAFTSNKPYEIVFINYMTPFFVLLQLIERARCTEFFSIDTETDDRSRQPAMIQVEFIQFKNDMIDMNEQETTIVIFEMCHLPSRTSIIYPQIQQLVDIIFHPSKTFLSWGNGEIELLEFNRYQLFQSIPITSLHFINVQGRFKNWYNKTYKHDEHCYMASVNDIADNPNCTCRHRPYKNPGDTWSLQQAIAIIFHQFLDKSLTRSNWGVGLDIRLYQNIKSGIPNYNVTSSLTEEQECDRLKLVKYVTDDCLALTKLASTIGRYLFND